LDVAYWYVLSCVLVIRGLCELMCLALIIYALGSALPVFTMSLVKSSLVALEHSDAQDFSIVMLTKTLGSLVGAPLMTVLWVKAIEWGGAGLGFPYVVSCVSEHSSLLGSILTASRGCIYVHSPFSRDCALRCSQITMDCKIMYIRRKHIYKDDRLSGCILRPIIHPATHLIPTRHALALSTPPPRIHNPVPQRVSHRLMTHKPAFTPG